MRRPSFFLSLMMATTGLAAAANDPAAELPGDLAAQVPGIQAIRIVSTLDQTPQPALYLPPKSGQPAPLLVHLHSWSARYHRSGGLNEAARDCAERGWAFVSPDFRGPNNTPQACASPLAIQDVLDAVAHVRRVANIDERRIYLLGGSGGGHMTLTMAHAAPQLWAGASAWVPITDLAAWHRFSHEKGARYAKMLEQCCGGAPGASAAVDAEYRQRSPLFFLAKTVGLPLDIQVGIHDGHRGSVPAAHSLWAFNALAEAYGQPERRIPAEAIAFITREAKIPPGLASELATEARRKHTVLLRRTVGQARLTVFEGAHETDFPTSLRWLSEQVKPAR